LHRPRNGRKQTVIRITRIADDKTRAVELARADVAKQIRVKIESELETVEQEFSQDNSHSVQSEISSRTKSVVSETVAGIEIKETKKVRGTYYTLAVLNKQNYLAGLEKEMDDIFSATTQYIQILFAGAIFLRLLIIISRPKTKFRSFI